VISSRIPRAAALICAALAMSSPLWLADSAHAQRRDFVGRVQSIDPQSIAVKDRRANIATFTRADNTVVEGKGNWDAIGVGDKVLVRWNLDSGIARHVVVLEGPPDAAKR
jgi:hypothetical protein